MIGTNFIKYQKGTPNIILAAALIVVIVAGLFYIGCLITAWAWNMILADLFGWPKITWLHAIAFFILIGILKGVLSVNVKEVKK
jgi:hypothetical protein